MAVELDGARESKLAGAVCFDGEVRKASFLAHSCPPRSIFDFFTVNITCGRSVPLALLRQC